jgi:predicted ATP-grasp superfamily ATP-dependent carboligase
MARLYLVKGKPQVVTKEMLECDVLVASSTAFVVDIEITKVGRDLHFPLIVKRGLDGSNHNVNECGKMTVDDIMLADLIKFQHIEFKIIRGYYWNGAKDYTIQSFIKHIFDMRNKYKKEGNPLQLVYKLIMNSAYGKTIQKPIDTKYKFFNMWNDEQNRMYNNYVGKNYQQLIDIAQVDGSKICEVITRKTTSKHYGLNDSASMYSVCQNVS